MGRRLWDRPEGRAQFSAGGSLCNPVCSVHGFLCSAPTAASGRFFPSLQPTVCQRSIFRNRRGAHTSSVPGYSRLRRSSRRPVFPGFDLNRHRHLCSSSSLPAYPTAQRALHREIPVSWTVGNSLDDLFPVKLTSNAISFRYSAWTSRQIMRRRGLSARFAISPLLHGTLPNHKPALSYSSGPATCPGLRRADHAHSLRIGLVDDVTGSWFIGRAGRRWTHSHIYITPCASSSHR